MENIPKKYKATKVKHENVEIPIKQRNDHNKETEQKLREHNYHRNTKRTGKLVLKEYTIPAPIASDVIRKSLSIVL